MWWETALWCAAGFVGGGLLVRVGWRPRPAGEITSPSAVKPMPWLKNAIAFSLIGASLVAGVMAVEAAGLKIPDAALPLIGGAVTKAYDACQAVIKMYAANTGADVD